MNNKIWEYRSVLLMSNAPLKGLYRFNDLFQIFPVELKASQSFVGITHYPFIMEYRFSANMTKTKSNDNQNITQCIINHDNANKTLNEILFLLAIFLQRPVFRYTSESSWFIPLWKHEELPKTYEAQWGQHGFQIDEFESNIDYFTKTTFPLIASAEANIHFYTFGISDYQEMILPDNIDELFISYFSMSNDKKKAFLSAASLFTQGIKLRLEHPSLSFTALVSSLETLIEIDFKETKVKKCAECGQKEYKSTEKFRKFLNTYGSSSDNFKTYANKMYDKRSKILHNGQLFLSEIEPRIFEKNESDDYFSFIFICKLCMINWLKQQNNTK